MPAEEVKILESFGWSTDPFKCFICDRDRHYYDLLSEGSQVCIECSVKEEFEADSQVVVHAREPSVMAKDPELIEIRNNLVLWEMEKKGKVKLDELYVPEEVAERLLTTVTTEGTSLDVVVTVALRMLFAAQDAEPPQETTPALPKQLIGAA